MSATTADTGRSAARPQGQRDGHLRVTQLRVIRSEWIKLWTLRSSWITLLVAVVSLVGVGILVSYLTNQRWDRLSTGERLTFDPVMRSIGGVYLAQLSIGVLGVLVISGEYATGMMRATLAAVPKRLPVLWAKLLVYGVVTLVLMWLAAVAAFLGGQWALGSHGTTLSAPHVARAITGVGLYLTAVGLLGVALGFLIRATAGGIATLFGLLLVLPLIVRFLPSDWASSISPYLPGNAGASLFTARHIPGTLAPWTGFGVMCGYAIVAIVGAAYVLRTRDA